MDKRLQKIALGGGCHWCTEAVFQSLKGVERVEQGYIASTRANSSFSEGVIVHFNPELITLAMLIEIHLYTHRSTSAHSFRTKYRSAVYTFSAKKHKEATGILLKLQLDFDYQLVTQVLPFSEFKASRESLQDYYFSNPEKPFCERYIEPKIQLLLDKYRTQVNSDRLSGDY
ncbi:peptide-methionine (S)-S-oxide reductase [Leeuwenhoekiella aestuarii]|uniref:peptide-methionine (S)-S-oxide reductase n=1 Tax=Leeuwenhoekiella aestuarii TaxID=2249426 RepID=A0A4Q0NVW7_9FLAO|nr:peptide-methionine (S)-S-oxide reductase [Leeuwenhoekiella aestuarii]RXG15227.1 peptide-methionine (S)-S-oxide reductase [Leeuwenhoekiella aestuarii]RXG17662.1 peptide-methionine (S)-S-oxide reductase [Leeuwenhoekiella aestuarii]